MKLIITIIAGFMLVLVGTFAALATEGPLKAEPLNLSGLVAKIEAEWGPLSSGVAEITGVTPERLSANVNHRVVSVSLGQGAPIYMNGRPAGWAALRPISRGIYVIARIWRDRSGVVRLIEARYEGENVRIMAVVKLADGKICLTVSPTEEMRFEAVEATEDCQGLADLKYRENGAEAFIVFDFNHRVRGVFLL